LRGGVSKMIRKILVPLDGSKIGESALPYVQDIISGFRPELSPEIILFHVIHPSVRETIGVEGGTVEIPWTEDDLKSTKDNALSYLNGVIERLKAKGINSTANIVVGREADEIVKFAESEKIDMIAMSTHGRSGIGRWALGSVADRVIHLETHIPISVIRAK
jgi:nucleotide-binding universal stress UspA family protein